MFCSQAASIYPDLDRLLKQAIDLAAAGKGLIQLHDDKTETLSIVSSYNLGNQFLTTFQAVKAFDPTACGRCFGLKIPITVDDVFLDKAFFPFREIIDLEEIRAAKSFPLYHLNEKTIVGVLSLYFPKQLYIRNSKDIPVKHFNKIALFLHQLRENRFPNVAEKSSK